MYYYLSAPISPRYATIRTQPDKIRVGLCLGSSLYHRFNGKVART
jgi:hypothetical protein